MNTLFDLALPTMFARPYVTRYQKPAVSPAYTGAVNVKEDETAFHLEVAAPGLKKEAFNVNVHEGRLTIGFKQETATEEKQENYTRREFGTTSFERSFRLPKNVDAEQIKATYTDGILTISLPKVAEVKPEPKVIEIA